MSLELMVQELMEHLGELVVSCLERGQKRHERRGRYLLEDQPQLGPPAHLQARARPHIARGGDPPGVGAREGQLFDFGVEAVESDAGGDTGGAKRDPPDSCVFRVEDRRERPLEQASSSERRCFQVSAFKLGLRRCDLVGLGALYVHLNRFEESVVCVVARDASERGHHPIADPFSRGLELGCRLDRQPTDHRLFRVRLADRVDRQVAIDGQESIGAVDRDVSHMKPRDVPGVESNAAVDPQVTERQLDVLSVGFSPQTLVGALVGGRVGTGLQDDGAVDATRGEEPRYGRGYAAVEGEPDVG